MLNFDGREEIKMEQEAFAAEAKLQDLRAIEAELNALNERRNQVIMVNAAEYARAAQYRTLLMTLRSSTGGDGYNLERVASAVVATFEELEGLKC